MTVSDPFMSAEATVSIFDLERNVSEQSATPTLAITDLGHTGKIKWAKWLPLSKEIVTAGEDGWIRFFDATTGEATEGAQQLHTKVIQDVQFNKEKTLMVTSSIDQSVVLFDVLHKTILKRYEVDRPVNSSAISPLKEHVLIGGGQDAMSVTTSSARSGKFECMFYHMILNKELGNVKGHFGPINTIAVNPNGRSYCSGGEDGYIRLHHFDASYFSMEG
jgi:translation initiation factor 3 subunit I